MKCNRDIRDTELGFLRRTGKASGMGECWNTGGYSVDGQRGRRFWVQIQTTAQRCEKPVVLHEPHAFSVAVASGYEGKQGESWRRGTVRQRKPSGTRLRSKELSGDLLKDFNLVLRSDECWGGWQAWGCHREDADRSFQLDKRAFPSCSSLSLHLTPKTERPYLKSEIEISSV